MQIFVVINWFSARIIRSITRPVTILCIVIATFSYTHIYLTLRSHQAQGQGHVHQRQPNGGGMPLNINQYRKTVMCMQITLVVCYLPYGIGAIFSINGSRAQFPNLGGELTLSLLMLNSTLNPLLYCWKIKEIEIP